jgi:hypothetical protein
MSVATQEVMPAASVEELDTRIKLLDEKDLGKLGELARKFKLTDHAQQREFAAAIADQMEQGKFRLTRIPAPAVDVAIEYLFVGEGLLVGGICSDLRLAHDRCKKRLMHLAIEAHNRLKAEQRLGKKAVA